MDVPCFKCELRTVGCHSKCEQYKLFKVEVERRKEKIRKSKEGNTFATSFVFDMMGKNSKRGGRTVGRKKDVHKKNN